MKRIPFHNRERELKEIMTILDTEPSLITFIYGPINSGKTTMVSHLIKELPKEYAPFYVNLRGRFITDYEDFLNVLFEIDEDGGVDNVTEYTKSILKDMGAVSGIPIPINLFEQIFEKKDKSKDMFKYIERFFVELSKKRTPVLIIDELQVIGDLKVDDLLVYKLFNFFIRLTKELHLAHVFAISSDSLFIEDVHSEAMLEDRCRHLLVDDFDRETTIAFLEEYGLSNEDKELAWHHCGGKPICLVELVNAEEREKKVNGMLTLRTGEIETRLKLIKELGGEILIGGRCCDVSYEKLASTLKMFLTRDEIGMNEVDGSDFPGDTQLDGDDIRFTDADGRELSYWIEEFDTGSKHAKIWVKVPEIPANGEAGITMWYGNPSASSVSDGDRVFEFFDDFEDRSLDTSKWNFDGNPSVADSVVIITGTVDEKIKSKNTYLRPIIFEYYAKMTTTGSCNYFGFFNGVDDSAFVHDSYGYFVGDANGASGWVELTRSHSLSEYCLCKVIWTKGEVRFYTDDNFEISTTSYVPDDAVKAWARIQSANAAIYIDWIRIRSYTSPEPTITISIENTGTTDVTDIEITDTIHPSFDLTSGDFPNPKRYDLIRPSETRDLQYTISAKESGTFTLDPATVTYADEDGNIQEAKSEPASIKVIQSAEGSTSGGTSYNPSVSTASVQLHGEKTNVVLGEDILFKLSAVNLITKPTMHVQVIIIPPSGMSVTSSAFAKSGAGQYTTTYELEPGTGKDIEVAIRSNQVGDFDVNGRIIYYFGDDREHAEDHTLNLPITVRAEADADAERTTGTSESEGSSAPGFGVVVAGMILFAIYLRRKRA